MVNPTESIPTYIQIDSVTLQSVLPSVHGSVSHKITDVWVYYNRELLGAFEIPAKVPVLADKRGELQIIAGVWEDGLSGIRAKYPFYNLDTFAFDPSPTKTIHFTPHFTYRTTDSVSTHYFVEDFEQGNSFGPGFGDTSFTKTNLPDEVFEGNWSSKLELNDTLTYGEGISLQEFTLPANKMCYLELNYKSDIPFVIRTLVLKGGAQTTIDLTGINPSSKWGKIYYNFGGFPTKFQNSTFKFIISAELPSDKTQGKVLIDNFKIIHFN